jgi:hypothetical protein
LKGRRLRWGQRLEEEEGVSIEREEVEVGTETRGGGRSEY